MADSPRKLLYLSLNDILSGISVIKTVARWNNQIGNEEKERGIRTPVVYIEIDNKFESTTASKSEVQRSEVIVTFHLGINIVKKDVGTLDWDIFQSIYEKVQGFVLDGELFSYTPLTREGEIEDDNYDGYYHGKMQFCATLLDFTLCDAKKDGQMVSGIDTLNITKNVE